MTTFTEQWSHWHASRRAAVLAPLGPLSLVATHWLTEGVEEELSDLPGRWRAQDGAVVATDVPVIHDEWDEYDEAPSGSLTLEPGDRVQAGSRQLLAYARDTDLALRVFDPDAVGASGIAGIDAFRPDPRWAVPARFEPGGGEVVISRVDGTTTTQPLGGTLVFAVEGVEHRLAAAWSGDRLAVVFGDATNGVETYRFRFIVVATPEADGATTVDFNRAYLPPCAFSSHFICPLPPAGNRLGVRITAGEKAPVRRAAA